MFFSCEHRFHRHRHHRQHLQVPGDQVVKTTSEQQWVWFGTRWHEIGFVGSVIQMFAASVFWISTITGIPGIIDMNNTGLTDGIFWVPQVIGGTGFIIARYFPTPSKLVYNALCDI